MLTDEGHKRIEDALLASAMRKLLTDSAAYVDTDPDGYLQIDGDACVTPDEAQACERVRAEWRRAQR